MNTLKIIQNSLLNTERLSKLEFIDLQKKIQNKDYIQNINTFYQDYLNYITMIWVLIHQLLEFSYLLI